MEKNTSSVYSSKVLKKIRLFILLFLIVFASIALNFFLYFQSLKKAETLSSSVLGSAGKRVKTINVNGQELDYKKEYLDFELPGTRNQPNFFSVPVTILYTDGSSRIIHLGFQYLQ